MSATVLDSQGRLETKIGQLAFDLEKKSADLGIKENLIQDLLVTNGLSMQRITNMIKMTMG